MIYINKQKGFTIVELLVVIVVIGILAAITIVSYTGISQRAIVASLQSDLVGASRQLKLFDVDNSSYPTTSDCSQPDSTTNKCLKSSPGNTIGYMKVDTTNSKNFVAVATNGNNCYSVTRDSAPTVACVAIGGQMWLKENLNVGVMRNTSTSQSSDGNIEKYCYNNIEANCDTWGGLYQWNEMMNYVTTEGAKGICPAGFHIPSDNDWKVLEMALGMSQAQADSTGGRGTDQGAQLRWSGSSGFNAPYGGYWDSAGTFNRSTQRAEYWTSTEWIVGAHIREIMSSFNPSYRYQNYSKTWALSVRCLKNP